LDDVISADERGVTRQFRQIAEKRFVLEVQLGRLEIAKHAIDKFLSEKLRRNCGVSSASEEAAVSGRNECADQLPHPGRERRGPTHDPLSEPGQVVGIAFLEAEEMEDLGNALARQSQSSEGNPSHAHRRPILNLFQEHGDGSPEPWFRLTIRIRLRHGALDFHVGSG
jgi:hypothetical protein